MSQISSSFDAEKWDTPMVDAVLSSPEDVSAKLAALALDAEGLIEAVRYAESERSLCTSNDVHGFSQMTVYDKAARALREVYIGKGWEKDETNNQAGISHPGLKIRVVPCNFDENCGNTQIEPTNRSPKGEVSKAKARCNATGWLPGLPEVEGQEDSEYQTWILGIFAVGGEPVRAELSFPIAFDGKYFTRFAARIILLTGEEDAVFAGRRRDGPEPTEVVDIPIARK